jgi:hypothetical protein
MKSHRFSLLGAGLGVVLALGMMATVSPAQAQGSTISRLTKPVAPAQNTQTQSQPLPPAVPGSKPNEPDAAPAEKANLDMPPTDALFDSINRGDLASAKDALGRGADLDGRNILGMTPLELSVDLGRNDISFLLLSLRGSDSAAPSRTSTTPLPSAKDARTARIKPPATLPRDAAIAAPPPRAAQLFAGSGGTPVPQAGFLGFGGAKQ